MNHPRRYDTNEVDKSKKFKYDGGMEFIATPERVAKFNTYTDPYDCQEFIHQEWIKENEVKVGGLLDLIEDHSLTELAEKIRKEESVDEGR